MRFGFSFDLHRLVEGRPLKLCGVEISFEKGLFGHSDGDVGLHALIDAMLSAAGLPDIGSLFPDKDPKYKNIDSTELLKQALSRIKEKGYAVHQIDLTFVCDRPKLSPYYELMKTRIAELTGISPFDVGIKARSAEGLLLEENKEIIACFCLVVLKNSH
ncbi:2-C-methyl-D-erythritol 2,4-cyclodiphosphate synthase [Thermodesulfobacterium hveragerdense]|uniref:2-C-methyl-D-erythritol 2,4-cyclodiphosphate synthase n=1 Tax=Thermodesulfobacterium hveragerdense TaxID=53424 RepID=UPI0004913866|nr:2-C-methyl-D-erythritol 2,4-cyclodiphosphate synthase [Thermodesulfobacterium hveragerdense]